MPSPAQEAERERLLAAVESSVTSDAVLGELHAEIEGSTALDPDDQDALIGRVDQYRLDNAQWAGESFDDAA
jgi:hypothetical protein